jgi:hypothetical protein
MELLMEQCEMESEKAHSTLSCIARAIQTGEFQDFGGRSRSLSLGMGFHNQRLNSFNSKSIGNGTMSSYIGIGNGNLNMSPSGKFRSKSMGAEHDYYGEGDAIRFLGEMLKENTNSSSLKTARHEDGYEACTLPDWSVAKRRDSPEIKEGVSVIEEEPSNFLDEEEVPVENTPVKYPETKVDVHGGILSRTEISETPTGDLLAGVGAFSPFLTEEERKVAEDLKNLPAPMFSFTPLKQDQLIPFDLLGVIDDPSTPSSGDMGKKQILSTQVSKLSSPSDSKSIPDSCDCVATMQGIHQNPIDAKKDNQDDASKANAFDMKSNETTVPQSKSQLGTKGKKKVKKKDNELAAALFAKPRSRSISYDEKSPKLKPMAPPPASKIGLSGLRNCSVDALMSNSIPALFQKQLDSAIEILMAMNFDICREAAHEAALVSNADVNIAQHVIDGALSAPPVCRHLLKDGCYRSDCQFSHDVDGHTCLFWLRGRCGKGDSCRFMHGFSEKLLDGVNVDFRNASESDDKPESVFALPLAQSSSMKPPIVKTGNLVQYNMKKSFSFSQMTFVGSAGNLSSCNITAVNSMAESSDHHADSSFPSMVNHNFPPSDGLDVTSPGSTSQQASSSSTFSFASIASKGYNKTSSFNKGKETDDQHDGSKDSWECSTPGTVRIPQNVWTAAQNRASGAFHISDPIARFNEVSSTIQRDDVIDLHFQSVKTFPAVLSSFLAAKLKDHGEVWVITGSGHHVSRNSHQKGGGVLENAVITWLTSNEYKFSRGKDKNGFGGALLVYKR